MRIRRIVPTLTVLLYVLLLAEVLPQGTKTDYERALGTSKRTENKVYRSNVQPHWLPDGHRFWYRVQTGPERYEHVLIDARNGSRLPLFDPERLAEALSKSLAKEVLASSLALQNLTLSEDETKLLFRHSGRPWVYHLATHQLDEQKSSSGNAGLKRGRKVRPSRRTGPETEIRFSNQLEKAVRVYWVDTEGERRHYHDLAPGATRAQHTFAGHVWIVTTMDGQTLGVFEASEDASEAVVDASALRETEDAKEEAAKPSQPEGKPAARGIASPDGRWRAWVQDHNLRLRQDATGEEWNLTTDGKAEDGYTDPLLWSPDSSRILVTRTIPGEDRQIYIVESSPKDQLQPKLRKLDYAKPGDRMNVSKPHLFTVADRKEIPIADPLFTNPWSIEDYRWAKDSSSFTLLYNQRGHQVLRVVMVDALTGATRSVVEEESKTFLDYAGKFYCHYLDGGGEILWMSERDGWNHLFLYEVKSGQVKRQVTRGEWVVREVLRVDETKREVWFLAGGIRPGQDPYYLHLARASLDTAETQVLTEGDGTHTIAFSPNREYFLDTWSRVDCPPTVELRRSRDGALVTILERADWSALLATGYCPPERFVAKARDGQTDIYGVIYRPMHLSSHRKYPVIEEIYAGPQGAFVPKAFGVHPRQEGITELGFIVVQIDGMGTSYRSKAFHDVCCKNLGDAGLPDRKLWIQAAAAKYPYLDTTRVGIYGGSAGGQNALRALLAEGDFYKVGVADCGCHDNRMDKIWWNELWMGWPIGPHYAEQSNVTQAHRLRGKLLLIVGEVDQNVDPASTMQVVNALIQADKDFELLVVPGGGHGIAESRYGSRRRMDFFVRQLLGVEPPPR